MIPNLTFIKAFIKVAKHHNMFHVDRPIMLFFKYPLIKVAAVITIQNAYRHYLWRKYDDKFNLVSRVIEHRAALCIQADWRYFKVTRRFKFLHNLKVYLDKIDSKVIYMEEMLYLNIEDIVRQIKEKSTKLMDQFISFSFDTE